MRMYDVSGNLVLLDSKDIALREAWLYKEYAYEVVAVSADVDALEFTLHRGAESECRDFIALLAAELGEVIRLDVSSTKREVFPPRDRVVELPF